MKGEIIISDQKNSNTNTYIGYGEIIIEIILLIIGIFLVGTSFENDYSNSAQSGSLIMFLIFLWESALIGVSGVMTLKADGQWGLSIVGNFILIFGDLFWFSKIWLAVICLNSIDASKVKDVKVSIKNIVKQ